MRPLTQVTPEATRAAVRRGSPVVRDGIRGIVTHYEVTGPEWDRRTSWVVAESRAHCAEDPVEVHTGWMCGPDESGWLLDPTDVTGRLHLVLAMFAERPDFSADGLRVNSHLDQRFWLRFPATFGLDPIDDTRLPDGSRWVDAEAIVLVANAVLVGP